MKQLSELTREEKVAYLNHLGAATESILPGGSGITGRCHFFVLIFDEGIPSSYVTDLEDGELLQFLRDTTDDIEMKLHIN